MDAVLNLEAGQFSLFFSPEAGISIGESFVGVAGWTVLENMPSNDQFRGLFESLGAQGGYGLGLNIEGFWSGPKDDWFDYAGETYGYFAGIGIGYGAGPYGSFSYSLELYRLDVEGHKPFPHQPNALTVAGEVTWAFIHDVVLNPVWPWSPYRR